MSETFDYVEEAKARDSRFAILAHAIAVEADLRDNVTIKALFAAIREDAERAMEQLSETSPADVNAISLLLVRISTIVYIKRALNTIMTRGQVAENAIRMQDEAERLE